VAKVRLDSWKSIAEYLRRSPRTVQRWHAEFGLPIHHFGGGKGPVFCYAEELDAWLSGFVQQGGENAGSEEMLSARTRRSLELTAQAEALWELRGEQNLGAIAMLYRGAVDHNPQNASAFIGIANATVLSVLLGVLRGPAGYPRAADALQRAQRLGAEGAEARCAAAWLELVHERRWGWAREGFDEVLDRDGQSTHALAGRALADVAAGDLEAAAKALKEAWRLNTFASATTGFLSWVQYLAGESEQALETIDQSRCGGEMSGVSAAVEVMTRLQYRPTTDGLELAADAARTYPRCLVLQGALGYAYGVSGRESMAREKLHGLSRAQGDSLYATALVLLGLEEQREAMSFLEASYTEGSLWSLGFQSDPLLKSLWADSRFVARLKKLVTPM
jgi:hypothetical protein